MKRLALLLLALVLLAPAAGAVEVWEKELGSAITAVATDERGDRIFVGTESGMLYCYDSAGSVVWSQTLAGEVVALEVDGAADHLLVEIGDGARIESRNPDTGATVWSYTSDEPRYMTLSQTDGISAYALGPGPWIRVVDSTGTPGYHNDIGFTATDLAISGDASWFVGAAGSDLKLYALAFPDWDSWIANEVWTPYQKRVAHTIAGSTDGTLTNYPVEITVIRGAGSSTGSTLYAPDCRADFADIRFTAADGVTQIPYYLESVVGNTATFLVNVPSIPASPGTTTIYVYWLNPSVTTTTSDPAAKWVFYDDFEDGIIDPALWTTYTEANGAVTEANGYLRLYSSGTSPSTARITSTKTFSGQQYYITANASFHDIPGSGANMIRFPPLTPGVDLCIVTSSLYLHWNEPFFGLTTTKATPQALEMWWNPATSARIKYGSDWDETRTHATLPVATSLPICFETGSTDVYTPAGEIRIYEIAAMPYTPNPPTPAGWGPVESIVTPLGTKTLDGTIIDIDAPETGDWVAVSTTTKTYIIQITDSGFGAVYSADRTGTPYAVDIANNGANTIEGRGILADIFRFGGVQTGTYTAGGPVRTVAVAQKNGLYAAAGSDDGKYYVFSKDASSSWYLLHASDSEDPVTALAMSWRGETLVVGRSDGHLVAFQPAAEEEEFPGTIRLLVYKDALPYTGAQLVIEHGGTDQTWGTATTITTDDYGVATAQVRWGEYVRVTVGENELQRVILPNPSQAEYVFRIKGPDPLRTGAQYSSDYDPDTRRIYLHYDDTRGKTHLVQYKIIRSVDNAVVFQREYSTLPVNDYYQIPAGWTNSSYRIQLTASGSPSFTNTWSQWVGADGVASLPADLDTYARMGIAFFLILFVAGLFSYLSGPQGAVVVSLFAGALVLWGWLPLSPTVIALCIVWAFLGLLGRTSGE